MRTLDNIERIVAPAPDVFWRDYVMTRTPVIVTDVYLGEAIREIASLETAVDRLAEMPLVVREEYTQTFFRGEGYGTAPSERWSLKTYVDFIRENPDTRKLVVEYQPPPALTALYQPSPLCRPPLGTQFMFFANPGNYAHLHFDWAPSHNLLFQMFGRKRATVIPARSGMKLNPLMTVGTVLLENLDQEDKLAFLRYVGAYDAILEPGDALYMPMFDWHHLEYLDAGLSISTRFGVNELVKKVFDSLGGDLSLQRDTYVQNLCAGLTDEEHLPAATVSSVETFLADVAAIQGTPLDVVTRVRARVRALHAELNPEGMPYRNHHYHPMDRLQEEIVVGLLREAGLLVEAPPIAPA